jgi:hypothetical protein
MLQGTAAVAIGNTSGYTSQGSGAIAIGDAAGYSGQGVQAIAIGTQAGSSGQGLSTTIQTWQNPFGTGLNSDCYAVFIVNNILYVGGAFTSVNGNAWNHIAQFNITTQTWSNPFGTGLNNHFVALTSVGNIIYVDGLSYISSLIAQGNGILE